MRKIPYQERFWSKIKKDPATGCWNWQDSVKTGGYGNLRINRDQVLAHRVSWEINIGPIPPGKGPHGTCVLHKCDNRACVNPQHLFLGSQQDNIKDRDQKGRGVTPKGESHGCAKATWKNVREIRALYATGNVTQVKLAKKFGLDQTQISNIVTGKHRKEQVSA